ncbi:MAG: hypothetical protein OHK0046_36050 [Anaerolineae bacterium]
MTKRSGETKNFLDYVQLHERSWGNKSYTGRPDLMQIMTSPVVVFWETGDQNEPLKITLHPDLQDIEKYLFRQLLGARKEQSKDRLGPIFQDQKRMMIAGVRIVFKEAQ